MTLRERIADWISGGALTFYANGWGSSGEVNTKLAQQIVSLRASLIIAESRLSLIAKEETPKANATVKRMAAIARGER